MKTSKAKLQTSSSKDSARLTWLLKLIRARGTNGISELPWTVRYEDGENSDIAFDRRAIDRAMKQQ